MKVSEGEGEKEKDFRYIQLRGMHAARSITVCDLKIDGQHASIHWRALT